MISRALQKILKIDPICRDQSEPKCSIIQSVIHVEAIEADYTGLFPLRPLLRWGPIIVAGQSVLCAL